jgi:hypothetical protein
MRAVIFTVLLSIVQAAPPVPRQTANSANQGTDRTVRNAAAQHKKPVPPVSSPERLTEESIIEKTTPDNPAPPNTEQATRVRELPSVSVTRDWIDKAGWFFSLVLVIVGIGGVCAAFRTLRAIERQAETMDRSLRVDQRAWMGIVNIRIRRFLEPNQDFVVEVESKNTGKTPALKVVFHNSLQAILTAEQINRNFGESDSHGTVMPDSKQIISIGENHPVSVDTFEQIHNGVRTMYFHGRIEYRDIFGEDHWTNWCFRLVGENSFVAHGQYNDTDDVSGSN